MKKLLALVLAAVMLLSFTACGGLKAEDVMGTLKDGHYKNTTLGIQLFSPAGWEFTDAEKLVTELGGETDLENATGAVYDMMVTNPLNGDNIIVGFENLGNIYGSVLSEQEYLEKSKEQVDGDGLTSVKIDKVEIAGQTMNCLKLEYDNEGGVIKQVVAVKKCENFMGIITITSFTDSLDQIINMIGKAS